MTWVLWDIFIPLLTSFGLGALLGWLLWHGRRELLASDSTVLSGLEADSSNSDSSNNDSSDNKANFEKIEAANIVLIQERDSAVSELAVARAESEVLQVQIEDFENRLQNDDTAEDAAPDNLLEAASVADKNRQLEEQTLELEQKLEQITVACQEERKAKRELELELLNSKNQYEKLEAQSLSADNNDSEQSSQNDDSDVLRAEFEALEVNHAKLQAECEEQKRTVRTANECINERQTEIDELKRQLELQSLESQSVDSAESELDAESELESAAVVENLEKNIEENVEEIEEEKQDPAPQVKNTQATSTGYVPASWSVPDTKPAKKDRDDLTSIKGVGPVLEKVLHDTGIYLSLIHI